MKFNIYQDYKIFSEVKQTLKKNSFILTNMKNQADVLWCGIDYYIDENYLKEFKNLRVICCPATGVNHFDLNFIRKKKVKIINLADNKDFLTKITPTVELTIFLIILSQRPILEANENVKKGTWNRNQFIGKTLSFQKVGILGLGRIGKIVAKTLSTLGCDVYYNDLKKKRCKYTFMSKKQLFSNCDIVSIHCNSNLNNTKIIDKKILDLTKKEFVLINTARGELVNESDLIKKISSNAFFKYYTDVLSAEHMLNGRLEKNEIYKSMIKNKNIFVTPHIGGATIDSQIKTQKFIAERLIKWKN